jgi:hypothetical protein
VLSLLLLQLRWLLIVCNDSMEDRRKFRSNIFCPKILATGISHDSGLAAAPHFPIAAKFLGKISFGPILRRTSIHDDVLFWNRFIRVS